MKRSITYKGLMGFAVSMLIIAVTGAAHAAVVAPDPTVSVNGTILSKCSNVVNGSMTFNIDPSLAGPLSFNTTLNGTDPTIKCTKNVIATVTCPATETMINGADSITYDVACPASVTGNGFSTVTAIPVTISVPTANYQDAKALTFTGSITISVSY